MIRTDEALITLVGGPDTYQRVAQNDLRQQGQKVRLPRYSTEFRTIDERAKANEADLRAVGEMFGIVYGKDYDDLFVEATLPPGWELKQIESYHSRLYDENGMIRGQQFYKAAYYDRCATFFFYGRFEFRDVRPDDPRSITHPNPPQRLYTSKIVEKNLTKSEIAYYQKRYAETGHYEEDITYGYTFTKKDHYAYYDAEPFEIDQNGNTWPRRPQRLCFPLKKKVEERTYLPDDQQPKPVEPGPYIGYYNLIDRKTGQVVATSDPYTAVYRGEVFTGEEEGMWYGDVEDARKAKARAKLTAWLDEHFPNHNDLKVWLD